MVITRIALFFGLLTPKWWIEHTSSHVWHPEQRSGTTVSFLSISA
jgi:hypothetical protein